jgi:transposase
MEAFTAGLDLASLGFVRAIAAATGRPGYDPRDLLKLYIWGYFNDIRSSRRLERACGRDVEAMCLMRKLAPDFKTIGIPPAAAAFSDLGILVRFRVL